LLVLYREPSFRLAVLGRVLVLGEPGVNGSQKNFTSGGVADAAYYRAPIFDHGDGDTEFGDSSHEFASAIEGIDYPDRLLSRLKDCPRFLPIAILRRREAGSDGERHLLKRGEWKRFEQAGLRIRAVGSVAYKLALVSAGLADATFTLTPKHEWDGAAGAALVLSAGGFVVGLSRTPNSVATTTPRCFRACWPADQTFANSSCRWSMT